MQITFPGLEVRFHLGSTPYVARLRGTTSPSTEPLFYVGPATEAPKAVPAGAKKAKEAIDP